MFAGNLAYREEPYSASDCWTSGGSDFYGSTRLGEVLAVIIRFSDNEWSPKQVLVRFKALAKSLTGEQLAGELIDVLATASATSACDCSDARRRVCERICTASGESALSKDVGSHVLFAHHRSR